MCNSPKSSEFRLQMQMGFAGTSGSEPRTPVEAHEHNYGATKLYSTFWKCWSTF